MERDCSTALEVHGSASTVGISVMVMVVVVVVEAAMVFWNGEAKSRSVAVALCGLVDQPGHHPPASPPAVSPNNTSLSVLRALSPSYIPLHKM